MKLFSALLATTLLVTPTAALAGNNQNGNGCRNRCGDTITNTGDRNVDNRTFNRAEGGAGGNGYGVGVGIGQGGRGGRGGSATIERGAVRNRNSNEQAQAQSQSQSNLGINSSSNRNRAEGGEVRNSGNSRNSNRNRSNSRSAANNSGNNQNTTVNTGGNSSVSYGDLPDTAVAPLGQSAGSASIGDIVVPLPTISAGAFASGSDYDDIYSDGGSYRSDYGVSIGINIPLGAGEFRDAARREIARRDAAALAQADRALFRLVQEAQWLQQQGLLSQEAHPRHWEALYGSK